MLAGVVAWFRADGQGDQRLADQIVMPMLVMAAIVAAARHITPGLLLNTAGLVIVSYQLVNDKYKPRLVEVR